MLDLETLTKNILCYLCGQFPLLSDLGSLRSITDSSF